MHFNWIDWIIVFTVFYQGIDGWEKGLVSLFSHTIAFLASLWVAVRFHAQAGAFLVAAFGLPSVWTNVVGYLGLAFPAEMMLNVLFEWPLGKVSPSISTSIINRWFGSIFAAINALIFFSFLLLVINALPVRGTVKRDIKKSSIGRRLVVIAEAYGGKVKSSLDSVRQEALQFLTITPHSRGSIELHGAPEAELLTVDEESESRMVSLVNAERIKRGVPAIHTDEALTAVARMHSRDMFTRRYFSHYSPEGYDVAARAKASGVSYSLIGENIAYAPDVTVAHRGFMESEGHRANILDPAWTRIGIGAIDGDDYGKIFTQVFANDAH